MGSRLLCWATLCLLGAEHSEAGVVQTPRHKITEVRQSVALWCDPVSSHNTLYWYRQMPGQGPELLVNFQNEAVLDDAQLPKNRFSAERLKGADSTLRIQAAEPGDSAVYLCASSLATVWQRHILPVHKMSASLRSAHRRNTDADIIQSPRHKITKTGGYVTLQCTPDINNDYMYWYLQDPALGMQLMHYSAGVGETYKGDIPSLGLQMSRMMTENEGLKTSPFSSIAAKMDFGLGLKPLIFFQNQAIIEQVEKLKD
ncbi:uncharacterized protein LOC105756611 [Trichechus manatus latirostris]|uniref:Uncharacterized protein LOC105756611 n=1 Tax=Trichechus manatus latirostris TaxID=127582 RepID=A0A2Y9RMD0_TRIMA|nr:uncharacterized protein LOC105756611 [Trichechus manatus latirostris]